MADKKIEEMNLFEKLSAISLEISNVNKNLNVGVGSSSYKAVGEGDVLAAVRPTEAKYRVYSYPVDRDIIDSGMVESVNYKGEIKKNLFHRVKTTYRFINMDKPDEFIDIVSFGDGIDTGDKGPGKAMTYSDKYALLKAYKIITGDDPDQNPSEPLYDGNAHASSKPKGTTTPKSNKKKEVSKELVDQLTSIGSSLEKVAAYKNMKVEELTDEIVSPVLLAMQKKLAAKKEANVTPTETKTE